MIITADSLLPSPKLDCNEGYDVAVKGPSVVVNNEVLEKKVDLTTPQPLVQLVHVSLGALCDLSASVCGIT